MTRIEKQTIINALEYYTDHMERCEKAARESGDLHAAANCTGEKSIACGLVDVFRSILNLAPCSVKI